VVMIQQILAFRRSGNRSLKAVFRLGYKYVLALIDPVLGTFLWSFAGSCPAGRCIFLCIVWVFFVIVSSGFSSYIRGFEAAPKEGRAKNCGIGYLNNLRWSQ